MLPTTVSFIIITYLINTVHQCLARSFNLNAGSTVDKRWFGQLLCCDCSSVFIHTEGSQFKCHYHVRSTVFGKKQNKNLDVSDLLIQLTSIEKLSNCPLCFSFNTFCSYRIRMEPAER